MHHTTVSRNLLTVIPGRVVAELLDGRHDKVMEVVKAAYLTHAAGRSVNPDSYFLRFPEKPEARIIALPAYLGDDTDLAGLKWIASFPRNIDQNLQRASAVLILNDYETGYPIAVLEASRISAHRTAASAALGARVLATGGLTGGRIAVIGAGVIARAILDYLRADGWRPGRISVHDLRPQDAVRLSARAAEAFGCPAEAASSAAESCDGADLVVLATTAAVPHLESEWLLDGAPTILNISLRDIAPDLILAAQNVVDDVDHCLKAQTSPHLAEQQIGGRDFVAGTLADVLRGEVRPDHGRARIFSPFGLGILDIAVGKYVLDRANETGLALGIEDFCPGMERW
jgi:N-[(2S)-2-amino-2-carboxyethyl]-L-glutamate dehydrogenase